MAKKKPQYFAHLCPNGKVEVGTGKPGYRWTPAYSQVTRKSVTQPLTRRNWQEIAKRDDMKLVFHKDEESARQSAKFDTEGCLAKVPENMNPVNGRPQFYDCGICGHYHPLSWNGDCRDDSNRFTIMELEKKYGDIIEPGGKKLLETGWNEVPMPGSEDDEE